MHHTEVIFPPLPTQQDQFKLPHLRSVIISGNIEEGTQVSGQNQQKAINGVVIFDSLKFYAEPGSKSVQFRVFSPNINSDKIRQTYGLPESEIINYELLSIDFNDCEIGEIKSDKMCLKCEQGTYSISSSQTECQLCPEYAECFGGSDISVYSGYWRSSNTSLQIHKCLNPESCIGGLIQIREDDQNQLCDVGYGGNLCQTFGLIPIILIIAFALAFNIFILIKAQFKKKFYQWVFIMAVIVIYFTHPTVSRNLLQLWFCQELDKGEYWVQNDLSIKCWEGDHLRLSMLIGLPFILFWVVGVPVFGFFYLKIQNKRNHRKNSAKILTLPKSYDK
ncbi:UNKNOWN [Stylonychia lemnae]|uniref:Transmembrane protein n=1 Tax=Stylonychia lemnae TaxID=5949 RepID=A0A078AAG6_STYLE|nr:UNKNOWN [Stylonychia lemnae]|eukprot:CDW78582.1 UNKNOWN [Stylonychia lemnae]